MNEVDKTSQATHIVIARKLASFYSSTMIDGELAVPLNNIRSLIQGVSDGLDAKLHAYRKGTRYESVRPSDVRVFVLALRQPRSISELARILGVTRQAVHASVKRLRQLKIIDLQSNSAHPQEKLVVLTDSGAKARQAAQVQVEQMEADIAAIIGKDGLENLRITLAALETVFEQQHLTRPRPTRMSPAKPGNAV